MHRMHAQFVCAAALHRWPKGLDCSLTVAARCAGAPVRRLAAALLFTVGLALTAGAATIMTERQDYQPGQYVVLTGTGWWPDETVEIRITESEPVNPDGYVWSVLADGEGAFTDASFEITPVHIGLVFTVTAEGLASGFTATTTFTDTMPSGVAPVNPPAGGFGIDGDLFPNSPTTDVGDWMFPDATPPSGSGSAVLSETGAPLDDRTTFVFLDGWGETDSDTVFAGDPVVNDNPNGWEWKIDDNENDETDLHHAWVHFTRDALGHTWVVLGGDRLDSARNGYIDFQFLQNRLVMTTNANGTTGRFQSAGPHGGRTINDFLLSFKFVGGETTPKFLAYQWRPDSNGGYRYVDVTASLPANGLFGAVNAQTIPAPYGAFGRSTYKVNTFGEAAVNLSAFLARLNPTLSLDIKTILVTTKSSKDNADLEDFTTPLQLNPSLTLGLAAEAGPDQTRCPEGETTAFPLQGAVRSAGSASIIATNWFVLAGDAILDEPTALTTTARLSQGMALVRLSLTTLGGGTVWDDVLLMVKPRPPCAITGPAAVCPRSTGQVFSGPADMDAYAWSIAGNGVIVGRPDGQTVTVNAGSGCDQDFTLTLTVTQDGCTETCSVVVFTLDTDGPVLSCPTGLEFTADPGTCAKADVTWTATATDACPGAVQVVCVPPSGASFPVGTSTVTCTAADACGRVTQASFAVLVRDTQPPVAECPPNLVVSADPGQATAVVEFVTDATDPCAGVSMACVPPSGSVFALGVTTVVCTATDAAGNTAVCSFTVTVADRQSPTVEAPVLLAVPADAGQCGKDNVAYTVTARDNAGEATVVCEPPSGTALAVGRHTVTCTATDAAGNQSEATFTVTVLDAEPPQLSLPTGLRTNTAPGERIQIVTFTVGASDNCAGAGVVCEPASGSEFPVGTTLVTCSATDAAGNTTHGTFQVTVQDTEAPQIQCPAQVTASAGSESCNPIVTFEVTATDNGPGVTVHCLPPSGSTFVLGSTLVTCTATDAAGNTSSCTFSVTVADLTPPQLVCAASRTLELGEPWDFDLPVATDACGPVTLQVLGTVTNAGCGLTLAATRTWEATDAAGHTTQCSQTVVVLDTTQPVLTCAGVKMVEAGTPWDFDPPSAQDAGGPVTLAILSTVTNAGCGLTFSALRTWVATDACGNTAECSQTVIVTDTTPPTLTCAADKTVLQGQSWDFDTPSASDASGSVMITVTGTTTNIQPRGGRVIVRTWSASDACGNVAQCSQSVTVLHPGEVTLTVESANGRPRSEVLVPIRARGFTNITVLQFSLHWDEAVAAFVGVEQFGLPGLSAGNFGLVRAATGTLTVSWDDPDGRCASLPEDSALFAVRFQLVGRPGAVGRVWLDDDPTPVELADDNLDPVVVTVVPGEVAIDLTTPPVLVVPGDTTVSCEAIPAPGQATALSDCDPNPQVVYLGETRTDGDCPHRYTLTRTWQATDACGLSASGQQIITVVDTTPPNVSGALDRVVEYGQPWTFEPPTVTDNCGAAQVTELTTVTNTQCGRTFTAMRTWRISDACGNTVLHSQTVRVTDTTPPTVVAPADVLLPAEAPTPPAPTDFAAFLQAGGQASDAGSAISSYTATDSVVEEEPCARTIRRTHTVTDACGNTGHAVQFIRRETPAPVVTISQTNFWAAGGTGRVQVTVHAPDCAWTAAATSAWLTFPAGASGLGSGELEFHVAPSRLLSKRQTTLQVAGRSFTIIQEAYEPMEPTLTVVAPVGFARVGGPQTNVLVSAQDNCGLAAIEAEVRAGGQIARRRVALSQGPLHVELPVLIELFPGTNVVSLWAVDRAGNVSLVQTLTLFRVLKTPIHLLVSGDGSITGLFDGQLLAAGKYFSVTSAPCHNCVLSNWTARVGPSGDWTVLGDAPTLTFEMQPGLTLQANFVPSPFLTFRGTYNGLFYETNGLQPQSSGFFTLTLGRRGRYTVALQRGLEHLSGAGSFALDGKATNVVTSETGQALTVVWTLDLHAAARQITGRVLCPQAGWQAEALGDLAPVYADGTESPFKGRYTFILPGTHDPAVLTEPTGDSFGAVRVETNGLLSLTGVLADGEPITQSAAISAEGLWPLYVPLYGGLGSLLGWVQFSSQPPPALSLTSARVSWIKPAATGSATYPDGFALETTLEGSRYLRQPDQPLLAFTSGTLSLTGGGLSQPLTACATLTPTNVVFACGAEPLTLNFVRSNGTFTGTYQIPGTESTVRLRGVVLQQQNRGAGYFRHAGQSGRLELRPRE